MFLSLYQISDTILEYKSLYIPDLKSTISQHIKFGRFVIDHSTHFLKHFVVKQFYIYLFIFLRKFLQCTQKVQMYIVQMYIKRRQVKVKTIILTLKFWFIEVLIKEVMRK